MAHCEKCISYDICKFHQEIIADEFITFFPNNEDCPHFKNKADFVEVVRCKDCKHRYSYEEFDRNRQEIYTHYGCYRLPIDVDDDDFCSYGKRRDT